MTQLTPAEPGRRPTATCRICAHPVDRRAACPRCEHRIRGWLGEIPPQLTLLRASLELDTRPTAGRGGASRAHSPLPVRGDVLALLGPAAPGPVRDTRRDQTGPAPVHAVLHAWADQLAEDLGHDLPPMNSRADYAGYLARHLSHALTRDWIAPMHTELQDLVHRIRSITRTEPRRRPKVAPCPNCAAFALFETDWQTYIDCEACSLLLTHGEYADHAATALPPLYQLGVLLAAHQLTHGQEDAAA